MDIFNVLELIGGLVLFLYGMDFMGDSLKKLAGGKLESILAKVTSKKFLGFLLGFVVTAVIQSSSATTVMLVGFVNSGIMKLGQTMGVILGANIGTTVTAWLLSTTGISAGASFILKLLKPESFTPVLALIGFLLMLMSKKDKRKNLGAIFIGFAILMFGMSAMSDAVSGLRNSQLFENLLLSLKNPVLGIIVGTIFTAIIQSSSASVGVLQALSTTGLMPMSVALPIILGQNIGTTITPIISSLSGNIEAKRVAFSCLYIKMIGVIVLTGAFYALNAFIGFDFMNDLANPLNIAAAHTLYNVLATLLLMPFTSLIEKLAIITIRSKKEEQEKDAFATLDMRFLDMPSFAVEKAKELVCQMADLSQQEFNKATALLDNYSDESFSEVAALEAKIDKYEDKISTYLVKVAETNLSVKDSRTVTELLHCIGDIERISDHALNIAETAQEINEKKIKFSDKAYEDITIIKNAVTEILSIAVEALVNDDLDAAKRVEPLEQVIDRLNRKIKNGHISRLRQGDCTMELGFILADLLTNYERISDHCSNIAVCFIEIAHDSFETHEYLNQIKSGEENEFATMYQDFKQKYYIE